MPRGACRAGRDRAGRDRGSATLEAALAVPALLAVALALVWTLAVGAGYVRAADAARAACRVAARGEPASAVAAEAVRTLPGAQVAVSSEAGAAGEYVRVSVRLPVQAPGGLLGGLSVTVSGEATALREPLDPLGAP